jgi:hypothetical protein
MKFLSEQFHLIIGSELKNIKMKRNYTFPEMVLIFGVKEEHKLIILICKNLMNTFVIIQEYCLVVNITAICNLDNLNETEEMLATEKIASFKSIFRNFNQKMQLILEILSMFSHKCLRRKISGNNTIDDISEEESIRDQNLRSFLDKENP